MVADHPGNQYIITKGIEQWAGGAGTLGKDTKTSFLSEALQFTGAAATEVEAREVVDAANMATRRLQSCCLMGFGSTRIVSWFAGNGCLGFRGSSSCVVGIGSSSRRNCNIAGKFRKIPETMGTGAEATGRSD
jgi:hypothetical protein